jgi:phosphoribosylformylglycinamidine synthase II
VTALHRALGLTDDEAQAIKELLGRDPNHLELALYAVMWSEHCSYKSSKVHLRRLPSEGARVLVGPGENAGIVDAGGGVAVALRIESHNHPSAIEPYQGAATGVGGILRDIFTMGARPIALMDPLRFGPLDDARSRWIARGVVDGISGYGNAVGVPTVGGEIVFDESYAGNPLVNVLCCGLLPIERLVLGAATGQGNLAILLGSATGRDGIGGVSVLASAGFTDDPDVEQAKRPNVQVGDPFEEKRLIEACLQLLDQRLVVGIQDLGGAGLICATSETASRGGVGMDVDVNAVHRREPGMEPWEVMTSESQERMLAIVTPADADRVLECCARWEVKASVVGRVTEGGRLRILDGWDGEVLADVAASTLHDDAPVYHRPMTRPADLDDRWADDPALLPAPADCGEDLVALLVDSSWVWRRYDHQLFLNTVETPGGDAALLRLSAPGVRGNRGPGEPPRAMALSTDGNGRLCSLDPRLATAMIVAESALNVACAGAVPVALVNCLNFGNPEHPEVMWQLSEAIDGMAEASLALDVPVVGGNVSLYNESRGRDIDPTPVVGTLGLIDELHRRPPGAGLVEGQRIVLVHPGPPPEDKTPPAETARVARPVETADGAKARAETAEKAPAATAEPVGREPAGISLAGSRWAVERHGHRHGRLAGLDLHAHRRLVQLVTSIVADGMLGAGAGPLGGIHDVSDGGLGVALAEMALRTRTGFRVGGIADHVALFGEGPSRALVCLDGDHVGALRARAAAAGLIVTELGQAGGDRLVVDGLVDLDLDRVAAASEGVLPAALS